jgi:hypothetical protein
MIPSEAKQAMELASVYYDVLNKLVNSIEGVIGCIINLLYKQTVAA